MFVFVLMQGQDVCICVDVGTGCLCGGKMSPQKYKF